jgi:hypothetical protein
MVSAAKGVQPFDHAPQADQLIAMCFGAALTNQPLYGQVMLP